MSATAAKTPEKTAVSTGISTVHAKHLHAVPSRRVVGTRTVLTRRGQVVFGLLVSALVLGVLSLVFAAFAPEASAATNVEKIQTQVLIVESGQTLWQIASELDPNADPRETIIRILDLNSLSDQAQIHTGQALLVPVIH